MMRKSGERTIKFIRCCLDGKVKARKSSTFVEQRMFRIKFAALGLGVKEFLPSTAVPFRGSQGANGVFLGLARRLPFFKQADEQLLKLNSILPGQNRHGGEHSVLQSVGMSIFAIGALMFA